MPKDALAIARAYHNSWTAGDFATAIALLSDQLQVEVPINDYPTMDSFAAALVRFGSQVKSVELLSEMAEGNQAMLLYDMQVVSLGTMRIVEHFTVADDKIVRLRQIHDTALLGRLERDPLPGR
jgi:hypothetical protein